MFHLSFIIIIDHVDRLIAFDHFHFVHVPVIIIIDYFHFKIACIIVFVYNNCH